MPEKLTEKKKQHYVPQMVQRRFSGDGKQINIWDIREGRFYKASIRNQFQERYFYEKTEGGLERALGQLERETKILLDQIEASEKIPDRNSDDWCRLILWAVMQVQRTDAVASPINQLTREVIRKAAHALESAGQIPEGPNGISVKDLGIQVNPRWGRWHGVTLAVKCAEAAVDLNAVLLQSRDGKIILPDCGAIRFNLIAEEGGTSWGWGTIGSGVLLPISNKNAVVIYDPVAYTWEGNSKENVRVLNETEEDLLAMVSMVRSTIRVAFNADVGWIQGVAANLYAILGQFGQPKITIPGFTPDPQFLEFAQNLESPLFGLPNRPTSPVDRIRQE